MNVLTAKLKEVFFSVLPIVVIVLILNFTFAPMGASLMLRFFLGAIFVIAGLTLLLIGIDIGITPIGNFIGAGMAKANKIWIVIVGGLLLGFIVSAAEPDLQVLAAQVAFVTSNAVSKLSIVIIVSIGIAVMLSIGLMRIVYNFPLYKLLTIIYGIIFLIAIFTSREFLAISFDASGATTGALTVPFILALAIGVSKLKKDSKASEKDSFGLVAIASTGAILAVMILSIVTRQNKITASLETAKAVEETFLSTLLKLFASSAKEIFIALLPIIVIFLLLQKSTYKLSLKSIRKILFGIIFTFLGMVLFIVGVNAGFMDVGRIIGFSLASGNSKVLLIIVGFVLGVVTILAEPAVYILMEQIEDVTSGYIKRRVVIFALCIGVGTAVALSVVRVLVTQLQLWHYLLPGYLLCIVLSFIVPKLFVGIAYDSGGVASGPMTATFIMSYIQGAADAIENADVLVDGFGMIAMVAMTPILALQILGFVFKIRSRRRGGEYHV